MKKICAIVLLLSIIPSTCFAGWYSSDWKYRKKVTVVSGAAGYPLPGLTVYYTGSHTGNGEVSCDNNCMTNFKDIIITEADGTTEVKYDVVSKTDSDNQILTTIAGGDALQGGF